MSISCCVRQTWHQFEKEKVEKEEKEEEEKARRKKEQMRGRRKTGEGWGVSSAV